MAPFDFRPLLACLLLLLGACAGHEPERTPAHVPEENASFSFEVRKPGSLRSRLLAEAYDHKNKPYVWNTNGPNTFDCSGFVHYVMRQTVGPRAFPLEYWVRVNGKLVPTSTYYRDTLARANARISDCTKAKPGDIVYFPPSGAMVAHIGFVTNPKKSHFITAQGKGIGVKEHPFSPGTYWGRRKPECYRNVWIEAER